ncbi:MAG: leucine-rich repeat domain-containing protein, partial [Clostridia bacterium]|nr:leucine-rich repeat domain-containing protein [Clostridia bacterium]
FTLPDGVSFIADGMFSGCVSLEKIDIPDGVTSIGKGAFEFCKALTEITIPDSVTFIDEDAFFFCQSLSFNVDSFDTGSYVIEYAKENSIPCNFPEDLSWLNS